jgi:hypothetical protein
VIHVLLAAEHTYTIERFFAKHAWGAALRERVRAVPYGEALALRGAPEPAVRIFGDLDRLDPADRAAAAALHRRLAGAGQRVLNDPARALGRHDLLQRLAALGINRHRAFRPGGLPSDLRFPVFVRGELDHDGSRSELLFERDSLAKAVHALSSARGARPLLVVELCDTSGGSGVHVKYGAQRIGDALVPRHRFASRHWEVKRADLLDPETVREEERFVDQFPHREALGPIFDAAGIEYGRIDYGVVEGRIRVFEINTNPVLVPPHWRLDPRRWPSQARSAAGVLAAFEALDAARAGA